MLLFKKYVLRVFKKYIPELIKNKKLTEIKNELIAGIIKLKKFRKIKKNKLKQQNAAGV